MYVMGLDIGYNNLKIFEGESYTIEVEPRKNVADRTEDKLDGVPLEETNQYLRQELYEIAPDW